MSTGKSFSLHSKRSIVASAGIIGFATFCSRILGFLRDVVIARLFGIYDYAQAFVISFKIPNLFRDLLGEGAANAAFIPVFSEYRLKNTEQEFWELANILLNLLLVILAFLTLAGIFFSPFIVRLIAPGFADFPEKMAITIRLTRIIFPYILLISLSAYATAILNSLRHFAVPAFAPCLLNISIIICALLFGETVKGLASGVLAGGVLQLVVQIPAVYKKGFRINRFLRNFRHPAAKTIGLLMLPRLFSSCIYQLNNFIDSIFGSLAFIVGEGAVAVLYFSYRIIHFPLGMFSNALSQAILPVFSSQVAGGKEEELKDTLSWGLRTGFFILVPSSVAFMVLSERIVAALFFGGRFDIKSIGLTANALFFYSFGLFAYGSIKILHSCFFALKDTATPAKTALLALFLNIILNSIFIFPLKSGGLALATSLSGISTFFVLFFILKRKVNGLCAKEIFLPFVKIFCASICMGGVCYFSSEILGQSLNRYLTLCLLVLVGFLSYPIFCFLFRVSELKQLWFWLVKKRLEKQFHP